MFFFVAACFSVAASASGAPLSVQAPGYGQAQGYDQDRGAWDEPPREMSEIQRRGFHDGIEGARHDIENHRNPDVNNRDEYRNADFPPEVREQYRESFRRGYARAVSRLLGGAQPPMVPPVQPAQPMPGPVGGWEPIPQQFSEIHRQGFQDGVESARRDIETHRHPDPDNHERYRTPQVPPQFQDDYREGFRRGYEQTIAQTFGGPQQGAWDLAPGQFSEIGRRGFQDGMDGARKDVENGRRSDPNNRDEYRNPNLPPALRDEYREGFRRGYERAMAHLRGR
jgi:hypothetical protein